MVFQPSTSEGGGLVVMSLQWLLVVWGSATVLMLVVWGIYHQKQQNAVLADVGFCLGFALIVLGSGWLATGDPYKRSVVSAMGAVYGFRLAGHLYWARVRTMTEDRRYQTLRARWGHRAERWLFLYFIGQAPAIVVMSLPLLVLMGNANPQWSAWEILGVAVWMIGISGEGMADRQLMRFRRDPSNAGKVCRDGLWKYSRHPNYFFEGVLWCGYVLMGVGVPNGWITLVGPVLMIGSLLKVTGIPLAEAQALHSRGDAYREYQRTTSVFIPWFPKQ